MKNLELILISFALMCFMLQIKAQTSSQMPKWALNGKEIDFVNETVNNLSSSLTSPKYLSNSYYNWDNEMLFHIIDNNLWWGNGSLAGNLFIDTDTFHADEIFTEMVVVPKKSITCNEGEYYVIYPLQKMVRDNDKSDNPIITYSIYYNEVDAVNNVLSTENLLIELESGINNFALLGTAVTDFLPATETRRLYYVYYSQTNDASSIKYFNIQSEGIYGPYNVTTINHNSNPNSRRFRPAEVEISSDLSKLVFTNSKYGSHVQNNNTNDITIVHLNPTTGSLNTSQGTNGFTYIDLGPQNSLYDIYLGLEFDAAMQNLYVTEHNIGLYRYNLSTGVAQEIDNTSVISNSQLELSRDGYISDEVATTYIQNTSGNDFAKASALLENSPLPSSVQSEIDNMEMNPALKSVVKQGQVGVNSRDSKRMKIAELKQFRGLVINEMVISTMNNESTDEDKATLIKFLQKDNNIQSKFHLVDINCKMQDFDNAKSNLESILQMIQSEDMQYIAEMEDYIVLQSIMIDIESGAIELEDAIESNLELINFIAENEDYPGELTAQLLLDEAGIRDYEELIRLPEPSMNNRNASVETKATFFVESYDDIINVYPNPTSDNIYIEYAFFNNNNRYVEIFSINGILIDKIKLNQPVGLFTYSKKLAAGNYIIKVGENYSQKITVQ